MRSFPSGAIVLCMPLVAIPIASDAQSRADAAAALAEAKTVRCEFPLISASDWKDGVPQAVVKPAKLSFRFEEVDADGGTAKAVGPFGASDINVRLTASSLHLMQSFREGPLYVTTVIAKPASAGRWMAVHTRHEYTDVSLPGYTSRPEQYYGSCTLEP
ncbi:MAG: hypothetical protein FJW27_16955 [Acidimicrobiia bacterium]|nr:hypothetical protein [Acidimicrobiia bacterium]